MDVSRKDKKKTKINDVVPFSFMVVYSIMMTTATITLIEALRTNDVEVRHVMNLETCISVVAGYYYSIFITKVNDTTKEIDWSEITKLRYIDWSITTPLMLVTLCVVLAKNSKQLIHFTTIFSIVVLNYLMLGIGYYGVIHPEYKLMAMLGGFIPFLGMFYLIYINYYGNKLANKVLFYLYFVVWSMYGIVYMFSEVYKNVWMNVLDLIAKCLIGIGLWIYYSKIINRF
jgi:bacteriorhodopsin